MWAYFGRRLMFLIPTLLGIMVINFFVIQFAPGGPVEQSIAGLRGNAVDVTARIAGGGGEQAPAQQQQQAQGTGQVTQADVTSRYRGASGIDPQIVRDIERQYGFDKPIVTRFFLTMRDLVLFRFGDSYYRDRNVIELIVEKLPVSLSLGLWTMVVIYAVCIPLGIAKAVRDGTAFDTRSTTIVLIGYAIPDFLFAILLIVLFAGGSYLHLFPLRGLVSPGWQDFPLWRQILDYFWHMVLPVTAMVVGGFAMLTMVTKNLFIEEINKQYVITARAKGLTSSAVLYGHVFRNAMMLIIAGFPSAFISVFFTGVLLIEIIFSLDGLGRQFYEATLTRDYPLMFGSLYLGAWIGLLATILRDISYAWIDPRVHFGSLRK